MLLWNLLIVTYKIFVLINRLAGGFNAVEEHPRKSLSIKYINPPASYFVAPKSCLVGSCITHQPYKLWWLFWWLSFGAIFEILFIFSAMDTSFIGLVITRSSFFCFGFNCSGGGGLNFVVSWGPSKWIYWMLQSLYFK